MTTLVHDNLGVTDASRAGGAPAPCTYPTRVFCQVTAHVDSLVSLWQERSTPTDHQSVSAQIRQITIAVCISIAKCIFLSFYSTILLFSVVLVRDECCKGEM